MTFAGDVLDEDDKLVIHIQSVRLGNKYSISLCNRIMPNIVSVNKTHHASCSVCILLADDDNFNINTIW